MEMTLDDYVEEYYKETKDLIYPLIDNLDFINDSIFYIIQIYYLNKEKYDNLDYNIYFDEYEIVKLSSELLNNINPEYMKIYQKLLKEKKIIYGTYKMSHTKKNKIYVNETNTIRDVIVTIHELTHHIHLSKYKFNMEDATWYSTTEMFAMMFEIYTLLKLYIDDLYKEELKVYFIDIFVALHYRADRIAPEVMLLNIYDKEKSISKAAIKRYKLKKGYNDEWMWLLDVIAEEPEEFSYHADATYAFGFPLSLEIASRMIIDDDYKNKVIDVFENVSKYSINEIFNELEVSDIIAKETRRDSLYNVMCKLNDILKCLYEEKELRGKVLEKR